MLPRTYAMPRFPYGQAYFPPNTAPVFAAYGQELPPLPPLPTLPGEGKGPTGAFEGAVILTGAAVAGVGWWFDSGVLLALGGAATLYGLWRFPFGAVARGVVGIAGR
jgi:hypothetical protein